jgi:Tol biopolymer transport system component
VVYPIDGGGEGRAVPGLAPGYQVVQWSADSRGVYVYSMRERPARIFLLDLETGQTRLWKEIPLDEEVLRIVLRLTPDGRFYVYKRITSTAELYLVEGLR